MRLRYRRSEAEGMPAASSRRRPIAGPGCVACVPQLRSMVVKWWCMYVRLNILEQRSSYQLWQLPRTLVAETMYSL